MTRDGMKRTAATVLAWVLGVAGLAVLPGEPSEDGELPDWVAGLEGAGSDEVPPVPWQPSSVSPPVDGDRPAAPATFAFPEPASWRVPLADAASAGDLATRPVRVRPAAHVAAGETVSVEVMDRSAADRVGASGFVFTVSGADRKLPAELTVDYSGFAEAYGAGYASRLRVMVLPECALAGCADPGTPLPTRNDPTAQTLTASVPDLSRAGTFAVTAAVDGEAGSFAATPLAISGTWQVAPGSGAFTYSYPIDLPQPAGGSAPTVSLDYSSAVVDGLTMATNTQASPSGLGWSDFANAFIERRYEPCLSLTTTDLCWKSENAVISLSGISGPLVPVNSDNTEWRALSDPGWKVERLTGATNTTIHEGQYWKVTGPDGTQYFFGYGHMPGRYTNSTLAVPVTADNPGEPCRVAGDKPGTCDQGWRWYLDRVVDPDGNVQSLLYEREDNWYWSALGALGGAPMRKYHRAALLKEIIYGGRDDTWDSTLYSARVTFGLQWRCAYLVAECPAPAKNNPAGFPDVPVDLICGSTGSCSVNAPSFFTGRRYSHVKVEVKVGSAWKEVVQHNLYHSINENDRGVAKKLQLEAVQHAGIAFDEPLNAYPNTSFGYDYQDNRVDHDRHIPRAMRHNRLQRITNPFGGHTLVGYGQNRPCPGDYASVVNGRWDTNDRDCFPQYVKQDGHLIESVFNKYLVTQVVEVPGGGSPNLTTSYSYEEDPAWAYDTTAFVRDQDEIGWSVWRGYGTVTIAKGTAKTRLRVFRGWDQDWMLRNDGAGNLVPVHGAREESVTPLNGGEAYPDHRGLAGRVLEEVQLGTLNGVAGTVVQSRRHEYERRTTFDLPPDYLYEPEWVGLRSTTETVYSAPDVFRQRRSQTTYNARFQPATTLEEGWLDVTGDERCSTTTYADNPASGMFVYPAVNESVAGACDSTQVLSRSETYYDGNTALGTPPTRGNPTRQRTLVEASRWSETRSEYDALGRPVKVTGPAGDVTATAFQVTRGAPATQIPVRVTVTNALGQQAVTDYHPEFGIPRREQDANGNVTEKSYDEFGRLTAVWLPTEPLAFAEPSWKFSYDIPNRAVRSQQLVSDARTGDGVAFEDTWVIYDGFWRERQAQGRSPVSGRVLVSETTYDDSGRLRDEMLEQALPGTPGRYLDGGRSWQNRYRHSYDELGRDVRNEWLRGGSVAHATVTGYGVDTVTVTGPDGRRVRERVDGHGRTVEVAEFDGEAWVSSRYGYDLADRLTSVVDPAGNRITYTYNLAGWRTGQQDPDRGSAAFGYDDAGNQISVVDAAGNAIHTSYDAIGRQLERRSGSPTGDVLASWTYDTAPGGKGALHRETTYTASGTWVSETLGYDSKSRPIGSAVTVPDGIPGLSGVYTVTQTYDRADRVRSTTYPAIGNLPQETVTTDYNELGLPTRMAGLEEYVSTVLYDDRGRKTTVGFGPRSDGTTPLVKRWTYNADQRVSGSETFLAGSPLPGGIVSDHELVFDATGNLKQQLTKLDGRTWRECFGYDQRDRLTDAYTVAAGSSCADGTPGTGDQPYVHAYQYSPDGKLTQRVVDGTRTDYAYAQPGAERPHAPVEVGEVDYTWDARGNLLSRGGDTFSWDVQSLLQSVTNDAGTTSFDYDASGQRRLRRTPDGLTTLYVAGHEVTVTETGNPMSAVRSYTFDDDVIATRTGASAVEYLISDPAGSVEMAVTLGGTAPVATRVYDPYGQVRSETGDMATDRGFIGQIEDSTTGLSYLNARYYDAAIGIFISTDPVYDTGRVKTLNPYTYSVNNPTSFTDPGGTYSEYAFGVERENSQLRQQNKQLMAHIGRLNSHIEELQSVIRKQQKQINKLISYARALEAEIARQASIIRRLQARVAYLERVVVAQQREIGRLRYVVARQQQIIRYQAGVIRYQAGVIGYYKGVVNVLGFRLWGGTPQYASVMASIHSFRGIPAGAFAYDNISRALASRIVSRPSGGGVGPAAADPGGGSSPVLPRGSAAAAIATAKLIEPGSAGGGGGSGGSGGGGSGGGIDWQGWIWNTVKSVSPGSQYAEPLHDWHQNSYRPWYCEHAPDVLTEMPAAC